MCKSIIRFSLYLLVLTVGSAALGEDFSGKRGDYLFQFMAGELFTKRQADEWGQYIRLDEEISWEVFVPESYDPLDPVGVLVYISPTRSGLVMDEWKEALADRNLIWIGANKSGNTELSLTRSIYAILGAELVKHHYEVDEQRIYVSGFSGGGREASILVQDFSHLFKGALYICGVNFWKATPRELALMKQNRFVFLTGTDDFNYRDTRNVYRQYLAANVRNVHFIGIKDMGHRLPAAKYFIEALEFLDRKS